ncbi:MAG: BPSS1187 family protein [Prosthecobacter sp.]
MSYAQTQTPEDTQTQQALDGMAIRPSSTDAAITEFDDPHWVYVNRSIVVRHHAALPADRKELLLWIPGTRSPRTPEPAPGRVVRSASNEFCKVAATLGYHVIALSYPNSLSASSCNKDADPEAFEKFRLAIIQGGTSEHITVSRTNSIENRLIKLLQQLVQKRGREDWGQFLTAEGGIAWEKIAVAGQSQGGGHSALIGIHHQVARVLSFGAPRDYSVALQAPAAWYLKESATPKERFYAFNHEQDRQGSTPAQLLENLRALKLDAFGPPVLVENSKPPYAKSHILMTNHPGTKVDSLTAHATMLSPKNKALFEPAWRYMLE